MSERKPYINSEDFDALMDQAFLNMPLENDANDIVLEAVSSHILQTNASQSTVTKKLVNSFKKFQLSIFIGSAFLASVFLYLFLQSQAKKTKPVQTIIHSEKKILPEEKGLTLSPLPLPAHNNHITPDSNTIIAFNTNIEHLLLKPDSSPVLLTEDKELPVYMEKTEFSVIDEHPEKQRIRENSYVFPKLTDKEIKANNKQRKKMLEQLQKLGRSKYIMIPEGTIDYNGEPKTIKGCYMAQTEVTNLEYRTFLFDLLIQNKKEAFLKARPNQVLWINSNGTSIFDDYKDDYFSEKRFNDYPVVNISYEAARLYCEWLNDLYNAKTDLEDPVRKHMTIRLPKESEWMYCAQGSFKNASFPWGTDSIQNKNHCFLANFCVQKSIEKFYQPYGYTCKINKASYTSAGLVLNNTHTATVKVSEYNPNWYGLFCMSGNVSEMVISDSNNAPKALGGNWGSDVEYLKISGPDEFKGKSLISPFIGFRPLISVTKER